MPPDLVIFPTSLALRQHQRRALGASRALDARFTLTVTGLVAQCAAAAARAGLLRAADGGALQPLGDLDRELAIVEAASRFLAAAGPAAGPLRRMAPAAVEETLGLLLETVSPLSDRAPDFLRRLAEDPAPKNRDLAALHAAYEGVCAELGLADRAATQAAILALLRGPEERWPECLRRAGRIRFVGVRWVGPFVEALVAALSQRRGRDRVEIAHILTDYEQDWWGGPLLTRAGSLLFGGEGGAEWRDYQPEVTVAAVGELISLREGLAMNDAALAAESRGRVGFSSSVGVYGEVEDLARRIAWALETYGPALRPEDIALVVRDLGEYGDPVADVFARFGIPYFVRRGQPVIGLPVVKALLQFARLSATGARESFCALLESPWLRWDRVLPAGAEPAAVADDIRRAGVEPAIPDAAVLRLRLERYARDELRRPGADAARYAAAVAAAFERARGAAEPGSWCAGLEELLARGDALGMESAVRAVPEASATDPALRRAYLLNARAYAEAREVIATLARHSLLAGAGPRVRWSELVSVLTRALANVTVAEGPPDEGGVWIVNPYDVAGLRFRLVLVAGLNDGAFPGLPLQDPLFGDDELVRFREELSAAGELPRAALAVSRLRHSQENLLFLTTLAAAAESVVCSYRSHDEDGSEQNPSVFFRTLWRLAGWPSYGDVMPAEPPDVYDRWRLRAARGHFERHWRDAGRAPGTGGPAPHLRRPFPGESFLATVPLALCRAADEARQRIAAGEPPAGGQPVADAALAAGLARGLRIEQEREAFLAGSAAPGPAGGAPVAPGTPGAAHSGIIPADVWARIAADSAGPADFSVTELESLATCPYRFYLERLLGLRELETNELEARPVDFGAAVHAILHAGFAFLRGARPASFPPAVWQAAAPWARLAPPAHAAAGRDGVWRLVAGPAPAASDAAAVAVAVLAPAREAEYLALFDAVAAAVMDWAAGGASGWMLGAPEQWRVECRRIRRAVRNVARASLAPVAYRGVGRNADAVWEGLRRCPALLEHAFDSRPGMSADEPSLDLPAAGAGLPPVRVHGKLDRVDLLFDADDVLRVVAVIDYKGKSRTGLTPAELAEEIAAARNCQLPVYGLAAARRFGPAVPVLAQYWPYAGNPDEIVKLTQRNWIAPDGAPVPAEELAALCGPGRSLADTFAQAVAAAVAGLRRGEFAVRAGDCDYCRYRACCRYASPGLPDAEGGNE